MALPINFSAASLAEAKVLGLQVVSAAPKLIFAVPVTQRVVQFPNGATISPYGQGNNSPAIVVQNLTDGGSYQGANSPDGVIIMNEVPEAVALELLQMYDGTIEGLDRICTRAAELGVGDQYTTKKSFVDAKLSPAGKMLNPYTGQVKRDDRDICGVYRDQEGTLQIMVGAEPRRIEEDILLRTYRNADGSEIDLNAIPVIQITES